MTATDVASAAVPRRWVTPLAVVHAVLCLAAISLPGLVLLAAEGQLRHLARLFAAGGPFMVLVLPAYGLVALLYAVLGYFFIGGKRVPGAALLLPAALPLLVGLGGTVTGLAQGFAALAVASPDQRPLLLVESLSEATPSVAVGALASGFLALGVVVLAFFGHLALDRRALRPAGGPARRATVPVIVSAAVVVFALGLSVALHVAHFAHSTFPFDGVVWLALFLGGVLAPFVVPALRDVDRLADERQRGELWRRAALMPFAMAASLALFGWAGYELTRSNLMSAFARLDPTMRVHLAAVAAANLHARPLFIAINAALGLVVLAVPLLLARKAAASGVKGVRASFALSIAGAAAVFLALSALSSKAHEMMAHAADSTARFERVVDVELPTVAQPVDDLRGGDALFVLPDGRTLFDDSDGAEPPVPFNGKQLDALSAEPGFERKALLVAAGRTVTFGALAKALQPVWDQGLAEVRLVLASAHPIDRSALGDLAFLAGSGLSTLPVEFKERLDLSAPDQQPPPGKAEDEGHMGAGGAKGKRYLGVLDHQAPAIGTLGRGLKLLGQGRAFGVLVDGDTGRLIMLPVTGALIKLPLGISAEARAERARMMSELRRAYPEARVMVIAPRANDDLTSVLAVIDRLGVLPDATGTPDRTEEIMLTPDRAALEAVIAKGAAEDAAMRQQMPAWK